MHNPPDTAQLTKVFDLIMGLAQVYRHNTMPFDTQRHENVAEHTYGLSTLACSLAASINKTLETPLDIGQVAQMGLVHDLPEVLMEHGDISVYADTQTLKAKAADEKEALNLLAQRTQAFPWITTTLQIYEAQETPEARFVHALDKLIVHIIVIISDQHHARPTYKRYLETEVKARYKITNSFPALLPYFEDLCASFKARPHLFSNQSNHD
jgi:5'-deoxynucleotidase YfbR-like HD superfamily hydrolase